MGPDDPVSTLSLGVIHQIETIIDQSIDRQMGFVLPAGLKGYIEKIEEIKNLSDDNVVRWVANFQKKYNLQLPDGARSWSTGEFRSWLAKHAQDPRHVEIDQRIGRERQIFHDISNLNCTHYGNGLRFINWYGDDVRYCPPFDWWYVWNSDEGRWARDDLGRVFELGKDVVLKLYLEAARVPSPGRRGELAKWAIRCEAPGSVSQLLESARTDPRIAIHFDLFDVDPYELNLKNGYLNLKTGEFLAHDKSRFFSMLVPIRYDPKTTCPRWIAFLDRIFKGHQDKERLIGFLQRAVGYSLSGDTSERAIFLLHGLGANGKTVLIRVLEALFGDYGASVSSTTFTTAMATNVRNDYARLKGKRFIWASENSIETALDEEMIKRVSGGDTIACRFLFREEFEYRPCFHIWWVFNHKPKIRDATDSIWDRIYLIPFKERIPVSEQDRHLVEKLITELPGIFNWALDGWKKFQQDGLQAPPSVQEATREYRQSEDALADFLQETFESPTQTDLFGVAASNNRMPFKRIWQFWTEFCNASGDKPRSKQWLGRQLDSRFQRYRTLSERGYLGLEIKQVR